jgi:hypothetical protein
VSVNMTHLPQTEIFRLRPARLAPDDRTQTGPHRVDRAV